ncbi:hypothetical protein CDB79_RS18875 [Vibrio parahaemolyticus]|uniref:hypothetical protein n=1 Tax=Vibrio parahaemolyticus TaxID=670 RepID=UPI000DFD1912|nr:hypothetical protein [Vibrio parahaemolyticus]EJG1710647.1 hypothetical protein [Vibrio parahaemolyticus]EJG1744024.1 hypothetical protein [Vibrio parahaemolyticus]EJG1781738.1 hypothetical protein [Vibrio parahaemolyticus]SUP22871.1 Uncharacterised protein [Vibrio parahaemolyticus]SUQ25699.1 Uncharacterised protein [Vibrio parahaemolyticus]
MKSEFSNGERFMNVYNVGQLKAVLAELDDEMAIESDFASSVDVVILHNMEGEPHIEFEEGGSN